MRGLFRGWKNGRKSPLEAELIASRPEPPARLVEAIVADVRPSAVPFRSSRARLGFAGALTTALLVVAGSTGGLAYAAHQIASAVHLTSPAHVQSVAVSSACSQYARRPRISKISPTKGKPGTVVTISGSNFSGHSRVTKVTFGGGVSAKFSVKSNTKIEARVPKGAKTGPITVHNCAGSASSKTFTVK